MSPALRRIALLGHLRRPGVRRELVRLRTRLLRRRIDVRLEEHLASDLGLEGEPLAALARWCDLLVSLGGDGTVLTGARAMAGRKGRLLAVNLGGLGFLAAAEAEELDAAVDATLAGRWPDAKRRLLRARVQRDGRVRGGGIAMNDAVVKGAGGTAAVHLQMAALGQDLGHLVADGVIAATAAGSTAYSLSAGGPVVAPDVEAMVVTPVAAHSLGSRSLVMPGDAELSLRVLGSFDRPMLLLDGQESEALATGDEVQIRLDRAAVRMVRNPDRPFGRALQGKLGWQGSARRSL